MNTRKFSSKQEKQVANRIGGKQQPNSGATAFRKGDVIAGSFCIECKTSTTEKQSISIKREWIEKIKQEAFAMNKPNWALVFNFGDLKNAQNFYIIDETLFKQLQQTIEEEE